MNISIIQAETLLKGPPLFGPREHLWKWKAHQVDEAQTLATQPKRDDRMNHEFPEY